MGWPKGKPRGPRKPKEENMVKQTRRIGQSAEERDVEQMEKVKAKTRKALDEITGPAGPFTVWVFDQRQVSGAGWTPKDFDTLQEAIDWPGKGPVYAITKPVKYEVREVGANPTPFRQIDVPQPPLRVVDWNNAEDVDRDDEARYV